jgi:hypothetical protein
MGEQVCGNKPWHLIYPTLWPLTSSPALVASAPATSQHSQLPAGPSPVHFLSKLMLLKHTAEQVSVHQTLMFMQVTSRVLPAQDRDSKEHILVSGGLTPAPGGKNSGHCLVYDF